MNKMKVIAFILFIVAGLSFADYTDTHYTRHHCRITEAENGVIAIEDGTGNVWEYETYSFEKNDTVNLKMYDNKTEWVEDDIILDIERD